MLLLEVWLDLIRLLVILLVQVALLVSIVGVRLHRGGQPRVGTELQVS